MILASWKFCAEKNCDQGLGNVAATPSQLITYLFFLSLNYVYRCCPLHSVNAVNYDKLIIFNEILSPPFLCDKNLCQSMFLH